MGLPLYGQIPPQPQPVPGLWQPPQPVPTPRALTETTINQPSQREPRQFVAPLTPLRIHERVIWTGLNSQLGELKTWCGEVSDTGTYITDLLEELDQQHGRATAAGVVAVGRRPAEVEAHIRQSWKDFSRCWRLATALEESIVVKLAELDDLRAVRRELLPGVVEYDRPWFFDPRRRYLDDLANNPLALAFESLQTAEPLTTSARLLASLADFRE